MEFIKTEINGLFLIQPKPHSDNRGWFVRTFCKKAFLEAGLDVDFVQHNQSYNAKSGTFRGMHFQVPPFAEKKLVRCVAGRILDFVIDIRKNSPTFLMQKAFELSAENMQMLMIPEGIAHGFITLSDETSVLYHHSAYYSPEYERGFRYNDPQINPDARHPIRVISERDQNYPMLPSQFLGLQF